MAVGPPIAVVSNLILAGHGPTVLFLPGSYSTAAAWRPVQRLLPPGWRMATTSLCGYGQTPETRRIDDFDIAHELRVVDAAARAAGDGPVHLVGHSFGGTVALAAALAGGFEVASLTLFEANPLAVLLMRGEFANAAMVALTALLDSKLPRARTEVVAGAGHFIASSHPIE